MKLGASRVYSRVHTVVHEHQMKKAPVHVGKWHDGVVPVVQEVLFFAFCSHADRPSTSTASRQASAITMLSPTWTQGASLCICAGVRGFCCKTP